MTRRIFNTVAGLVVMGIGSAAGQTPAPSVPAGNAKTGQALFMKIGCYQCHGNEAQEFCAFLWPFPTPVVTDLLRRVSAQDARGPSRSLRRHDRRYSRRLGA